jgi:DNA-directed RNA polymerase sigma subunit (sigma70/sigma32)
MTKDEIIEFLKNSTPEEFFEIKKAMIDITNERELQEDLAIIKARKDRVKRICDLHDSGMTFKDIGSLFNISGGRCQQIHQAQMRKLNSRGQE